LLFNPASGGAAPPSTAEWGGTAAPPSAAAQTVSVRFSAPGPRHVANEQVASPPSAGAGVANTGNTCYAGAVLAAFAHTPGVAPGAASVPAGSLHAALASCCAQLASGEGATPDAVGRAMQCFMDNRQHDAHEFLVKLLGLLDAEALSAEALSAPAGPKRQRPGGEAPAGPVGWVQRLLRVSYVEVVRCTCGHSVWNTDVTYVVSVPVLPAPASVQDMVSALFVPGPAGGYKCDECGAPERCTQSVRYGIMPPVLLLQLKRFVATRIGKRVVLQKNSAPVALSRFLEVPGGDRATNTYELVGVVGHAGDTPRSGHYVASYVADGAARAVWLTADDANVTQMARAPYDVPSASCYLLSYQLAGGAAAGPP
jgi:ubiquitin C-terminal hydrolase